MCTHVGRERSQWAPSASAASAASASAITPAPESSDAYERPKIDEIALRLGYQRAKAGTSRKALDDVGVTGGKQKRRKPPSAWALNVMAYEKKQPASMGKQGGTSTSA